MSEAKLNVTVEMTKNRRFLFLASVMVLAVGYNAASYGSTVVTPRLLTALDGMSYYPLNSSMGTLGMMLSLPIVGKLCDIFGSKAVPIFGVLLQIVGRLAMPYAINVPMFMCFFALSSVGGGLFASAPFALIADVVEPKERTKYYGMLVTFKAAGSLLGPLITGLLVDAGYIKTALLSYLPFAVLSVPLILVFYPNLKKNQTAGTKFDYAGVALLILSICCIILWISLGSKLFPWFSSTSFILLAVGIVSLTMLIRLENKHPNPAVALFVFKKKRCRTAFICQFLSTAFATCTASYLVVYMQREMQLSGTVSSTATMPQTIVQLVFAGVIGGFIGKNFKKLFRPASLISLACTGAALFAYAALKADSPLIMIYIAVAIGGFGTIVPQACFTAFFQEELKPGEMRAAQGMYSFSSSGGSVIFGAVSGAVLNAGFTYNNVFFMGGIFLVLSLIVGFVGLRIPKTEEEAAAATT